jgi:hypothetical protein
MSSCRSVTTSHSGTEDGHPENVAAYQGRSLDCLGVDILLLIFDEVFNQRMSSSEPRLICFQLTRTENEHIPVWVRDHVTYRKVSRQWNKLALPLIYNTITLTYQKVYRGPLDRDSNRTRRRVWANMRTYTRHLIIEERLNWNDVVKLLVQCKVLESIKYLYLSSQDLPPNINTDMSSVGVPSTATQRISPGH